MRTPLPLLSCCLALFAAAVSPCLAQTYATANSTVYLSLKGVKTGVIRGEVTRKGLEDWHELLAYSHEIVSPRDAASGLPTGRRQHQPFRVVKHVNRASPQLLQVLATNEKLTEVIIDIWTPTNVGSEVKLLSYKLTNASLVSLRPWMPNKSDAAVTNYPPAEELAFTYERITVTYTNGDIVAEDDWLAQ